MKKEDIVSSEAGGQAQELNAVTRAILWRTAIVPGSPGMSAEVLGEEEVRFSLTRSRRKSSVVKPGRFAAVHFCDFPQEIL